MRNVMNRRAQYLNVIDAKIRRGPPQMTMSVPPVAVKMKKSGQYHYRCGVGYASAYCPGLWLKEVNKHCEGWP
jgi:hypothetical protein